MVSIVEFAPGPIGRGAWITIGALDQLRAYGRWA